MPDSYPANYLRKIDFGFQIFGSDHFCKFSDRTEPLTSRFATKVSLMKVGLVSRSHKNDH